MRLVIPALIGAAFLAGCGGGGGSSNTTAIPAATPTANAASTTRTPIGSATLTIKFSPYFHTAKASIARKAGSSAARRPAYVNSAAFYLDIWVVSGNTPVHAIDTSGSSPNVTGSADGSQTLTIPLYSQSGTYVVAYERDEPWGETGNLLSVGEADLSSFTPGTAPQVALTMAMNARSIGVMSDPNDANGDATTESPYYTHNFICSVPASSPLYFFAADAANGFVNLAGAGGVSQPTVTGWTSQATNPGNWLTQSPGVNGAYSATFNNSDLNDGLVVNLSAVNPAYPIAYDAYYDEGQYPGIDYLVRYYYDFQLGQDLNTAYYEGSSLIDEITILPNDGC